MLVVQQEHQQEIAIGCWEFLFYFLVGGRESCWATYLHSPVYMYTTWCVLLFAIGSQGKLTLRTAGPLQQQQRFPLVYIYLHLPPSPLRRSKMFWWGAIPHSIEIGTGWRGRGVLIYTHVYVMGEMKDLISIKFYVVWLCDNIRQKKRVPPIFISKICIFLFFLFFPIGAPDVGWPGLLLPR